MLGCRNLLHSLFSSLESLEGTTGFDLYSTFFLPFHHASFYQQSLVEQAWYLQAWFICEQQYQERHGSLAYQKRREHKLHSKVNHQSNPLLEDHGLGVSTIWQWSLKQKEIPIECNSNNLMIRIALQWTVT